MAKSVSTASEFVRSFAAKLIFIVALFLVFPVMIYARFTDADREYSRLLIESIQREGVLIARSLRPLLSDFRTGSPEGLQEALDRLRTPGRNIKVLARTPAPEGPTRVFYLAASPKVTREQLDSEREQLISTGVFDQLTDTCEGNRPLSRLFVSPSGEEQLLTSFTPVRVESVCFVVLTAHTGSAILSTSLGRPVWKRGDVRLAMALYLTLSGLVLWLFISAWRNLNNFRRAAHELRVKGPAAGSFAARNRIPELAPVADDIDRLVEDLHRSRRFIRDAAEETAHALKAPLAVMSQSMPFVEKAIPPQDERATRSLARIDLSIRRMDALISAARNLESQVADLLEAERERVDVSALVKGMAASYGARLADRDVTLEAETEPGLHTLATEDVIETILENILDNACDFAPPRTRIAMTLKQEGGELRITIQDQGPGVDPARLDAIFERNVSFRDLPDLDDRSRPPRATNFGIGLWIVRRHIEALGGRVSGENVSPNGFRVTITLPAAD